MTEDERQKITDLHDFFMKPAAPGRPSRAEQIDDALTVIQMGKMSTRGFLWICGLIVGVTAAYTALIGWRP